MINNKKVLLTYIICFFLFATLLIFPKYTNNTRLFTFYIKEQIQLPFFFIGEKFYNFFYVLNEKQELNKENNDLKNQIQSLEDQNNYLKILTSKYIDQHKVFHNSNIILPQSIGIKIIGDRDLIFNKSFIINKGSRDGIQVGNYVVDGNKIVGRIKAVNYQASDVITVYSTDYGEEVIINGKSYILTGTNNIYLSFLRKKDALDESYFFKDQLVYIKDISSNLLLGKIDYLEDRPVIISHHDLNLDNLRVLIK